MSEPAVSRALAPVRVQEWWYSKIPPLLAVAYAWATRSEPQAVPWMTVAGVLAAICCVAAFGYIVNDAFDIDEDRRSGRPNRMANFSPSIRLGLLATPILIAAAVAIAIELEPVAVALLGANFALPALYSIPPVRWKERGVLGVFADAGAAHLLPTLLLGRTLVLASGEQEWHGVAFVLSAATWSFLVGLRGIMAHQVADLASDRVAGVRTFASMLGAERTRRLALRYLRPFELVALGVFLWLALPAAPLAVVAVAAALVLEALKWQRGWVSPEFARTGDPAAGSEYVPLLNNELYELWLPLGFVAQLVLDAWIFAPLAMLHLLAFLPNIRTRLGSTLRVFDKGPVPTAGMAGAPLWRGLRRWFGRPLPDVVLGATYWTVNGVNVFSANLARGLMRRGDRAEILLTEEHSSLIEIREARMPRASDLVFAQLSVPWRASWGTHWAAMIGYLEDRAPCIYVPNSDWRHSCVVPMLSNRVVVVGVVHSDDPLHYDHVKRLGRYWNAIVCVSQAVADKTVALCPELADRIVTIPIGADVPRRCPPRATRPDRLRLVYHGVLKQHQKRVLDFPRIVAAADALGVPVTLTLAGTGPDEAALREACAALVERGLIRFAGLVPPWETPALLEAHDVYLLASEFEGMPNALIEAMGRGCVPVVTRMTSGIPQLVREGENGFMVPIGDAQAFAGKLQALWQDRTLLDRLSTAAHRTVVESEFRVERMVESYRRVFVRAADDAAAGRFVRPNGLLNLPPASVAGVGLFPVSITHDDPRLGAVPSEDDADDFEDEGRRHHLAAAVSRVRSSWNVRLARRKAPTVRDVRIVVAANVWIDNGVNRLSEDLVRGCRAAGLDARLLLTEERSQLVHVDAPRLPRPEDIPVEELTVGGPETWGARWGAMQRYLEDRAPCIYLPNDDWRHACVVPRLSNRVSAIATVHEETPLYWSHVQRAAGSWNAVVVSTRQAARRLRTMYPAVADRVVVASSGLALAPEPCHVHPGVDGAWHVLVLALGPERRGGRGVGMNFKNRNSSRPPSVRVTVLESLPGRCDLQTLYRSAQVVVTPSLGGECRAPALEAMGHGCVPVLVTNCAAERDTLLEHEAGLVVANGDALGVAASLEQLARDPGLFDRLSQGAHRAARRLAVPIETMVEDYLAVFERVLQEREAHVFAREAQPLRPPPASVEGVDVFPVALGFTNEIGSFPSEEDFAHYAAELGLAVAPAGVRARGPVALGVPR